MNIIRSPIGDTDSICTECKYLLKRIIIPLNGSNFGINKEELEMIEDGEVLLEHYMCTEALLDLDHIVVECNKFERKIENTLLRNKF